MPLTPLRTAGLLVAIGFAALSIRGYRQGKLGNGDLLVRFLVFVLPLLVLSAAPDIIGWGFDEFSFKKGGGRQVLGATVLAVGILYLFAFTLSGRQDRSRRDLTRLIENLALEQFEETGHPEAFAGGIAVVIPAYNEAENIHHVLAALPDRVCDLALHAMVIDDGSADRTTEAARTAGAAAVRLPMNRGQGAALRTGYRLALVTGAEIVVTMDADGQHQPSELSRLVSPIANGEVDVVNGSRVLGEADPNHAARELGVKLFAQLLSLLTWSRVTDPACGYRAVRTEALRGLEFRQDQFHNSEFIVEASKKGLRSMEVPVTITKRISGESKKPAHFRYGMGFANALVRAWLR
ncbi:MAG TPA: glycosyltransferase family 2 protein [Gaiellales bacterium]|nr:glycosyltransferase family 2 protein [Gaiellales bacterium]